jgi:hypothetical protein
MAAGSRQLTADRKQLGNEDCELGKRNFKMSETRWIQIKKFLSILDLPSHPTSLLASLSMPKDQTRGCVS